MGLLEGCSDGYWKNHLDSWGPTGYNPDDSFNTVFGRVVFASDFSLEDALNQGGGGLISLSR